MPEDFPHLEDGDALEPWHLNVVYAELRRWRKLKGAEGLDVDGAEGGDAPTVRLTETTPVFIRLTGAYSSGYPWEEVLIGPGRTLVTSGVAGDPASGDPAFERQSGDTTLTADGTVYEARRSPACGELSFDGKN
jgi:hypothetical protein